MGRKEMARWVAFHVPDMTESNIQAVLSAVRMMEAGDIVNTLRSDEEVNDRIWQAVCHHLRYSAGYPDMSPEQYQGYVRHDGTHNVAEEIRAVVRNFVLGAVVETLPTGPEWIVELIKDGFAFDDEELWHAVALDYVPGIQTYANETGQEWK